MSWDNLETPNEYDLWFRWFQLRELAHRAGTYLRLREHLAIGGEVTEHCFRDPKVWSTEKADCFIAEVRTPEYLAEHLTSRHMGFGGDLVLSNGVTITRHPA